MVSQHVPRIIFLSETKCGKERVSYIQRRLRFDGCFSVRSNGRSGGMPLLWSDEGLLSIKSSSAHHIDADVAGSGDTPPWRLTGFYGFVTTAERSNSWDLIRQLCAVSSLPWMIFGDFNEVLLATEKFGGRVRSLSQMQGFRDTVGSCNLGDLGFKGDIFTWANSLTKCRLDRCLANLEYRALFRRS